MQNIYEPCQDAITYLYQSYSVLYYSIAQAEVVFFVECMTFNFNSLHATCGATLRLVIGYGGRVSRQILYNLCLYYRVGFSDYH